MNWSINMLECINCKVCVGGGGELFSAFHIFFHIILKTNIVRPGTIVSMFRKKEENWTKMSYLLWGGGSVFLDCQDDFRFYFTKGNQVLKPLLHYAFLGLRWVRKHNAIRVGHT